MGAAGTPEGMTAGIVAMGDPAAGAVPFERGRVPFESGRVPFVKVPFVEGRVPLERGPP